MADERIGARSIIVVIDQRSIGCIAQRQVWIQCAVRRVHTDRHHIIGQRLKVPVVRIAPVIIVDGRIDRTQTPAGKIPAVGRVFRQVESGGGNAGIVLGSLGDKGSQT